MSEQMALLARNGDPWTSAAAVKTIKQQESQRLVLDALRQIGPATDEQIYDALADAHISPSRARTARVELQRAGIVKEAGEGLTRSKRKALTWEVVR